MCGNSSLYLTFLNGSRYISFKPYLIAILHTHDCSILFMVRVRELDVNGSNSQSRRPTYGFHPNTNFGGMQLVEGCIKRHKSTLNDTFQFIPFFIIALCLQPCHCLEKGERSVFHRSVWLVNTVRLFGYIFHAGIVCVTRKSSRRKHLQKSMSQCI